ncbi:hypothetical protein ASF84_14820 [Pseudomonas sp. Leaf127]|uniref:hypothetical protein n=1 Tax=Pseudomonas sp. Leaf127 TaxID=1736267 RepID=UPI0007039DAF|nr:hypothetical protein [Pseudomonas sp. Leaf127]KQQ54595.1 hypothetical protein ASF84_14820 [Pseudomonas sp. Leaf127]
MLINTPCLIANPCDDEYDDMALLCCHGEDGDLFSLSRFPDENEIEISLGDDKTLAVTHLKVTFGAERLLVELDAADAARLGGDTRYEIRHASDALDLREADDTLRIILANVGIYVSEIA